MAGALIPLVPAVIDEVQEGSPAARGGIQPGDRIVSIDGIGTPSFDRVSEVVQSRPDQILRVVVERAVDGATRQLTLTVETGVEKAPRPTDGKFVDVGVLGVGGKIERIRLGPVESVITGTK